MERNQVILARKFRQLESVRFMEISDKSLVGKDPMVSTFINAGVHYPFPIQKFIADILQHTSVEAEKSGRCAYPHITLVLGEYVVDGSGKAVLLGNLSIYVLFLR